MRIILSKVKIDTQAWAIALLIIPAFTVAIGYLWPQVGVLYTLSRIAVACVLLFIALIDKKLQKRLNNKCFIALLLMYAVIIICTEVNQPQNVTYAIELTVYGIIPFLAIFWFSSKKISRWIICKGISLALNILTVANLCTMFLFPNGIHTTVSSGTVTAYYLFGSKNQIVAPILTCLFFETEKNTHYKTGVSSILIYVICIAQLLLGGSGTGLTLLLIFSIFVFLQITNHAIPLRLSLVIVIASYIGLVILRIQNILSFFIVDILHKSLTLSNRTIIWDSAIDSIVHNPLIGTGTTELLAGQIHIQVGYDEHDTFAHNLILDYLLMGGLLAGILFILIIYFAYRQFSSYSGNNPSFIWCGIITYLLASIVEIYQGNFCLFLMIAYLLIIGNKPQNTRKVLSNDR